MIRSTLLFGTSALLVTLLACGGDNTSTAFSPEQLDGDATTASFAVNLNRGSASTAKWNARTFQNADGSFSLGNSGVTITSARLNVEQIEIELPEGLSCDKAGFVAGERTSCEEENEMEDGVEALESEIKLHGPFVFDLMTGESTPDLASFTLPSGAYKEIEIEIHEAELGDGLVAEGDDLIGYSLVADGTFVDADGVSHGFQLKVKFTEEIEIESVSDLLVAEGVTNSLVASLDPDAWLTGIDLAACVADGDLSIDAGSDTFVIDDNTSGNGACGDIEGTIKENIKNSFEFDDDEEGEDDDSDDDVEDV